MAAPGSAEEFLDLVRKSGVVDEKRLDTYAQQLRSGSSFPDEPGKIAGYMVRDGLLTHFQAEQVLLGKWRRFTIGKYKVLERLGSGGMGSVYLCEHKFMRRRVAVKVLPAAKAEDPASLERFYREARAAAALDHPNIVRAYDIDQDENLHFLVMEYVDGASLQEIIKKTGQMNVLRACHYIRQAAIGMQHAHEAGLVHRDIKPGNLLVDRTGTVKVLDMGLARFFHDEEDILTKKYDESVLGTADYLAPEQALDSHGVDIRADVYSLGATFYFCLTGQPPFNEGTVAQKLIWHQTRQPKPVRSVRADVPEAVAAVIDKMMTKDRGKRFQNPAQVAEALAPFTTKPIPPPPDTEMPRLSPAAMGGSSEMSATMSPGSTVPQQRTPAPPPQQPAHATPAPRPSPVTAPAAAAATRAPAAPAAPRPQQRPAAAATAAPNNGAFTPTPAPAATARAEEQAPDWGDVTGAPLSSAPVKKASSRSLMGKLALGEKLKPVTAKLRARPKLWGGIGGGLLLVLIILIVVLSRLGGSGTKATQPGTTPSQKKASITREPQKPGEFRTIAEALKDVEPGDRVDILLTGDHEEVLNLMPLASRLKEVQITIQSDPSLGRRVVWRPPPRKEATLLRQLLFLSDCPGLTLKSVVLNGQNTNCQTDDVLILYGRCLGLKVEDVDVTGFSQSGVKLINPLGDADRPLLLKGVQIKAAAKPEASAVVVDVKRGFQGLTTLNHVRLEDCRFEGPLAAGIVLEIQPGCDVGGLDLVRNRFFKTASAVLFKKPERIEKAANEQLPGLKLSLDSNTVCDVTHGLRLEWAPHEKKTQLTIRNNLFVRTGTLAGLDSDPPATVGKSPAEAPINWIWFDEGDPGKDAPPGHVYFRKTFTLAKGAHVASALLEACCDDSCTIWINGTVWKSPLVKLADHRIVAIDVASFMRAKSDADEVNCIAVQGSNDRGPAGLLLRLTYTLAGNPAKQTIITDNSWKAFRGEPPGEWNLPTFQENDQWRPAKVICPYGKGMTQGLTWDSSIRDYHDQINKVAQRFSPTESGNARDAASPEGNINLHARTVDTASVNTDPNSGQFLRYPKSSPLNQAGAGGGPVGVPPEN
jgi:serine/threonine protein kinase